MNREKILAFAPHPDDEILGCGGYLALLRKGGADVRVVVVTDGGLGIPRDRPVEMRREECRSGLAILGISDVVFWGYPDGQVPLSGRVEEEYRRTVLAFGPNRVLVPAPTESHPDHRRVTRGFVKSLEGIWRGELYFYETVQPGTVNASQDITSVMEIKLQALRAHASQLQQFDYVGHCEALARMRGVAIGKRYAEAFLTYQWDGTPQNFFETRPLISVIVRADDEVYLRCALASLAAQGYDQLEVVLVWFGEHRPEVGGFEILDLRVVAGERSRSRNLNLGLANAKGDYVAFLDQDDVLYPDHFALLLAEIQGRSEIDIVYSGCRLVSCTRREGRVEVAGEISIKNEVYRAGRLIVGNFIPNHALLYRANVFRGRRYDEELGAYEDWEMLARLELEGFHFWHLDAVTCEYRLVSDEEFASPDELHERRGYTVWREKVLDKILRRLKTGDLRHLASIVDALEKDKARLEEEQESRQAKVRALEDKLAEFRALENLLARGLTAIGIEKEGRSGAAALIGRGLPRETLFSILLPVFNTPGDLLAETLFSVRNQAYGGWELCVVDDASSREDTGAVLRALREEFGGSGRVHFARREEQGGIVAATMDAVALGTAPYLVFLDHDDLLHEEALLSVALVLKAEGPFKLLYTDSRVIDRAGQLLHIYRKSRWAPETLLHMNYVNHLTVVRRDVFQAIGGLRSGYEGSQDWDLLLRLAKTLSPEEVRHVREPLYDWRAAEQSVAYRASAKPWAYEAAQRVIEEHLSGCGLPDVTAVPNAEGPGFICQWRVDAQPIEVIIPTRDNVGGLKKCLEGLVEQPDYPQLSVTVVANQSRTLEMREFLEKLAASGSARILFNDRAFNWAALNNQAVAGGNSALLLFLNDDVEIQDRGWLRAMVRYVELAGVGVVGATLLYPYGTLQHNGIRTDPEWIAANITSWGPRGEFAVPRNVSAVTGACLLVKRRVFEKVGGFDERLAVAFNDVDFCLAVRTQNLRIVQATDVRLIHHESVSRGGIDTLEKKRGFEQEIAFMREKWGDFLIEWYLPSYDIMAQATRILHLE